MKSHKHLPDTDRFINTLKELILSLSKNNKQKAKTLLRRNMKFANSDLDRLTRVINALSDYH